MAFSCVVRGKALIIIDEMKTMKEKKITLNRTRLSAGEIASLRDFERLLKDYKAFSYCPAWKNAWFWGIAGMATLSIPLVMNSTVADQSSKISDNQVIKKDA